MKRDKGLRDTVSMWLRGRPDCFVMPECSAGRHGGLASMHHSRSQLRRPGSYRGQGAARGAWHIQLVLDHARGNANDKEKASRTSLWKPLPKKENARKYENQPTRQAADNTSVSEYHLQLRMLAEIRCSRDSDWARQAWQMDRPD